MNLVLCFLVAFLAPIRFTIVGEITAGELLIPVLLFANWKQSIFAFRFRIAKIFLILAALYLASQIFTDIYRSTPSSDYLRGWAKILLTSISYAAFLGAFYRSRKNFLAFCFGYIFSTFLQIAIDGYIAPFDSESYKWRFGIPFTFLTFVFASRLLTSNRSISLQLMLSAAAISLVMNFRSLAGITILATLIVLLATRNSAKVVSIKKLFAYSALFAIIGISILQMYAWLAPNGYLGEVARDKYFMQSRDGEFSLLSGRSELFLSLPKIIESPFVGWGSWAKDSEFVYSRYIEMGRSPSYARMLIDGNNGLIPTHSHIFGGWLEAGLFGGVFWITFAWLVFRNLAYMSSNTARLQLVLISLSGVMVLWDLIFSPYGAGRRAEMGAYLALHVLMAKDIGFVRLLPIRLTKGYQR